MLGSLLKRDRVVVLAALTIITLLAWTYLWSVARQVAIPDIQGMQNMPGMKDMPGKAMSAMAPAFSKWSLGHAVSQFAMWAVMMVGMMTPSVTPVVMIYARFADQAASQGVTRFASPLWFALGYLSLWTVFAIDATGAQWGLERAALLTPMLASANRVFGGAVLVLAGIYQWSPFKDTCLSHCRAPLAYVQSQGGFKPGVVASVRLGVLHGAYCIGCCWMLMALLFVAGVMNLVWIAALMLLVLLEKLTPYGRWIARFAGTAAIAAGAWTLAIA